MNGSIRKIKNQSGYSYQVTLELGMIDGKRQRSYKTFCKKSEAENYLYINKFSNQSQPKKMVCEVCDEWLKNHVEKRLKDYTQQGYRNNIRKYIKPYFKGISISDVSFDDLQDMCDSLSKNGLEPSTVHGIMVNMSSMLKYAHSKRYIESNPYGKITYPRPNKVEHDIYSIDEIKKLFECSKGTDMETPIKLAAVTGMRRGEILALRWCDVDFVKKQIHVRRSVVYTNKQLKYSSTKSYSSDRTIETPTELNDYLQSLYKERLSADEDVRVLSQKLIALNDFGQAFIPNSFSAKFNKLLAVNDMKHIRFHDLRHTNAHLLLYTYNVDYKAVSEHLGHSRISTTLDYYAKGTAEIRREALSKLSCDILQ